MSREWDDVFRIGSSRVQPDVVVSQISDCHEPNHAERQERISQYSYGPHIVSMSALPSVRNGWKADTRTARRAYMLITKQRGVRVPRRANAECLAA